MTAPLAKHTHSFHFPPQKCELLNRKHLMHETLTVQMPQAKQNSLNGGEAVRITINLFTWGRRGKGRHLQPPPEFSAQQRNSHQVENNSQILLLNGRLSVGWLDCIVARAIYLVGKRGLHCLNGDIYVES